MKPVRALSPPGTYFISSTTAGRRPFFSKEKYALLLVEVLYHYRKEGKYRLHEWVLMPEHIHLLLTPALGVTIERAMQFIKGGYSHRAGKELTNWEIWQRGFADHRIRKCGGLRDSSRVHSAEPGEAAIGGEAGRVSVGVGVSGV